MRNKSETPHPSQLILQNLPLPIHIIYIHKRVQIQRHRPRHQHRRPLGGHQRHPKVAALAARQPRPVARQQRRVHPVRAALGDRAERTVRQQFADEHRGERPHADPVEADGARAERAQRQRIGVELGEEDACVEASDAPQCAVEFGVHAQQIAPVGGDGLATVSFVLSLYAHEQRRFVN